MAKYSLKEHSDNEMSDLRKFGYSYMCCMHEHLEVQYMIEVERLTCKAF